MKFHGIIRELENTMGKWGILKLRFKLRVRDRKRMYSLTTEKDTRNETKNTI